MTSRYQLLDDEEIGAGAQHSHDEAGQETAGGSHNKRAALAVFGAGLLLLGGAAAVLQRGSVRSTAKRHNVASTRLVGGNHLGSVSELYGGDRDAHGCIGSAGYVWCASESECIRAREHNLTTEYDIKSHCSASGAVSSSNVGGDRDTHGCIASAGYSWCASMSECIRPWEHNLTSEHDIAEHCGDSSSGTATSALAATATTRGPVGSDRDTHGCIGSAGYRWCASRNECIRPWEHHLTQQHDIAEHCGDSLLGSAAFVGGDRDVHGCTSSAGYSWCASMSECIRPWEHNLTSEHNLAVHCGGSFGTATSSLLATSANHDLVGGDDTAHGCITSAGYSWCASMSECIRPWEHNLTSEHDIVEHCGDSSSGSTASNFAVTSGKSGFVGGDLDVHGCIGSAGFRWCVSTSECIRPWEHNLTSEHDIAEHCSDSSSGTVAPRTYFCNCPPTEVMWQCSQEQYQSIMNGTDCEYYRQPSTGGD